MRKSMSIQLKKRAANKLVRKKRNKFKVRIQQVNHWVKSKIRRIKKISKNKRKFRKAIQPNKIKKMKFRRKRKKRLKKKSK